MLLVGSLIIQELRYEFASYQAILYILLVGNLNALIATFWMKFLLKMGKDSSEDTSIYLTLHSPI